MSTPLTSFLPPDAGPADPDLLEFPDIDFKTVSVSIGKGEQKKSYVLRQASEKTCAEYENKCLRAVHLKDLTGSAGATLAGAADVEAWLVSRCLFVNDGTNDGRGTPVTLQFVEGLPRQVVGPLARKAKEISGLVSVSPEAKREAEAEAKKSPTGTGTGSA